MTHFAFPNVEILNQAFIGCGRYIAADSQPSPLHQPPASIVINRSRVDRAATCWLRPESAAKRELFEIKDRPEKRYAGESMQLALLLATINRKRELRYKWDSDIWCTGIIDMIDGKHVVLQEVAQPEFAIKLAAFLADDNPDRLFIVPQGNAKLCRDQCDQKYTLVMGLTFFHKFDFKSERSKKIILMVKPDELPQLIIKLFEHAPNPYKGLEAYQIEDVDLFFGRERLTRHLRQQACELLTSDHKDAIRMLPVLGPSGSGKSSLVRAGLIPALIRQAPPGFEAVHPIIYRTDDLPMKSTAKAVFKIQPGYLSNAENHQTITETVQIDEFDDLLAKRLEISSIVKNRWKNPLLLTKELSIQRIVISEQFDELLKRWSEAISRLQPAEHHLIVFFIDQLEEVFTLCRDKNSRNTFIDLLFKLARHPTKRFLVIFTLRSDFLGETQSHQALNGIIASQGVITPAMTDRELSRAIALPAERNGYPFDQAVIDRLVDQTCEREGALPLLQFALRHIWDNIANGSAPADTLNYIGGVGGAMAREAQRIFNSLNDRDKAIARRAFTRMVALGEGIRDTRRRVELKSIIAQDETEEVVKQALEPFANPSARLITLTSNNGDESSAMVELTHEAILEHWQTYKQWIHENRNNLQFHRRVEKAAFRWKHHSRPKGLLWRRPDLDRLREFYQQFQDDFTDLQIQFYRASERAFKMDRIVLISVIVLFLIIIGGGFYYVNHEREIAQKNELIARESMRKAEQQTELANYNERVALNIIQKNDDMEKEYNKIKKLNKKEVFKKQRDQKYQPRREMFVKNKSIDSATIRENSNLHNDSFKQKKVTKDEISPKRLGSFHSSKEYPDKQVISDTKQTELDTIAVDKHKISEADVVKSDEKFDYYITYKKKEDLFEEEISENYPDATLEDEINYVDENAPVKIASIFAHTEKAAINDLPFIKVAQLSIDEINQRGGLLGEPVDYVLLDNKSKPISSQAAAEKAVKLKVSAVVGAVWSSQSLAMAPVCQEAGIPMITPVSTHPDVTLKGDYIFRACFTDTFQSKVLARFAYEKLKARKAGVIRIVDQEFSTKIANLFAESFEKIGGKLIFEGKCKSDAVDFKALLKEMKEAGPDVVFVPAYAKQSGFLVRQAAAMGVKTVFLSGDGWSQIIKYAGEAADGCYYSTHWHPNAPFPSSVAFCEAYQNKYGEEIPSQAAAVVYDAFMVLADAVKRANSSDPAKIRNALAATENFQGITGSIEFDKNGDPIDKSVIIIKIENGKSQIFTQLQ